MTVIATASNPRFSVSRIDVDRPGSTYTVDTLRGLQAELGEAELFFITGSDALAQAGMRYFAGDRVPRAALGRAALDLGAAALTSALPSAPWW